MSDAIRYFITVADWEEMADFVLPPRTVERALRRAYIRQSIRDEMRLEYGAGAMGEVG